MSVPNRDGTETTPKKSEQNEKKFFDLSLFIVCVPEPDPTMNSSSLAAGTWMLSSVDAGAVFRGLPASTKAPVGRFVFTNCLGRPFNSVAYIKKVTFGISRYGEYNHTIEFASPQTEKAAVAAAEDFLSQPLTQELYEQVRSDTALELPWNEAKEEFSCIGDVLGDAVFMELLIVKGPGHIEIVTGS
ncbi:MAG: hypothetical protein ACYCOU_02965 [Sulfobacillus sp.]